MLDKKHDMKKKIKFLFTSYFVFFLIGIISCEDDCGGNNKYNITSFNWKTYQSTYSETSDYKLILSEIIKNSVLYNQYSILITPQTETDYSFIDEISSFNIISSAYACSPAPPYTDDRIENIEIFSNQDFNSNNLKGKNLVKLFDIIVKDYFNEIIYERFDLTDYLTTNPLVPSEEIVLVLKESPEMTAAHEFTIKYYQNGNKLSYFEFSTNPIEIRTE